MADSKSTYSEASTYYVDIRVPSLVEEQKRFERAKLREALFNENWKKQAVNLNEIIAEFCPIFTIKEKNEKFIFKGKRYHVQTDMASGYLKIFDSLTKKWIKLDGSPADFSKGEGHYKIKKREEM